MSRTRPAGSSASGGSISSDVKEKSVNVIAVHLSAAPPPPPVRRVPKRISLVQETVATLKRWIRAGELNPVLPGEMRLKRRLGVGRDTLRLALKLLTKEGWISHARPGCQRVVLGGGVPRQNSHSDDHLPVTCLSLKSGGQQGGLLELDDLQMRLAAQGRDFQVLSSELLPHKHPERWLEQIVQAHPSAAWVLGASSQTLQRWFSAHGLPALLCELPFEQVNLPYVAPDWEGAAFHAGLQLIRNGHRVIGLLECRQRTPRWLAEQRGLQRALDATNIRGRLVLVRDGGASISVARSLDRALRLNHPPTALVLTRAAQLLTCYSSLASHGIRVPADISIVALAKDKWFTDLHPAVCHYQPDRRRMSRGIAERIVELAVTGRLTKKSLRVRLKYVPGLSIGPTRSRSVSSGDTAANMNLSGFQT